MVQINNLSKLKNLIVLNWALIFFTLPFSFVPLNSQLIILLLILSFFYFRKWNLGNRISIFKDWYLFIPAITCITSWIFISDQGLKVLEKEAPALIFPIIVFLLANSNFGFLYKDYLFILGAFITAVIIVIIFTSIRFIFLPTDFLNHEFLTFDIIHPTYFSFYCGVVVLILIEFVSSKETISSRNRWLVYVAIGSILSYMTILSSRMPLIATVGLILILLFLSVSGIKKRVITFLCVGSLISALAYAITFSPRLEYRFYLAFEKNFTMRINEWKASWDIYAMNPYFGIGVGSEQVILDSYYRNNFENAEDYVGLNSHNYFLHILMVYGSVGFLLILFFWLKVFKTAHESRNRLLVFSLILFVLCSMTEVMLARQKGIVFFFLFFSVHLFLSKDAKGYNELNLKLERLNELNK